jgi:tetratricopeptide (TPR) repeat protein
MDDAPDALAQALTAVDLALTRPAQAARLVADVEASGDAEARAVAGRARGLAFLARGELSHAARTLRATAAFADRCGLRARAGEAKGSLAYVLTLTGDSDGALDAISEALPLVEGASVPRLQMQRALVLAEIGRFAEAAPAYAQALDCARRTGAPALVEADIRNNRSILATQLRDWRGAEADLARAEEIYTALGHVGRTALVQHNRALAAAVRGDIPAALAYFDDAERRYHAAGRDAGLRSTAASSARSTRAGSGVFAARAGSAAPSGRAGGNTTGPPDASGAWAAAGSAWAATSSCSRAEGTNRPRHRHTPPPARSRRTRTSSSTTWRSSCGLPWVRAKSRAAVSASTGARSAASTSSRPASASSGARSTRGSVPSFHSAVIASGAGPPLRTVSTTAARPSCATCRSAAAVAPSSRCASSTPIAPPAAANAFTAAVIDDGSRPSSGARAPHGTERAEREPATQRVGLPTAASVSLASRVRPTPAGPASTTPAGRRVLRAAATAAASSAPRPVSGQSRCTLPTGMTGRAVASDGDARPFG